MVIIINNNYNNLSKLYKESGKIFFELLESTYIKYIAHNN